MTSSRPWRWGLWLVLLSGIALADDDVPPPPPPPPGTGTGPVSALDALTELAAGGGLGPLEGLTDELGEANRLLDGWKQDAAKREEGKRTDGPAATPDPLQAERAIRKHVEPVRAFVAPAAERTIAAADAPGLESLANHVLRQLGEEQEPARREVLQQVALRVLREKTDRERRAALHPPSQRGRPRIQLGRSKALEYLEEQSKDSKPLIDDGMSAEDRRVTALRAFGDVAMRPNPSSSPTGRALPTLPWCMAVGGDVDRSDGAWPPPRANAPVDGTGRAGTSAGATSRAPPPPPVPVQNEAGVRIEFSPAAIQAAVRHSVGADGLERRLLQVGTLADARTMVTQVLKEVGRDLLEHVTETPLTEVTVLSLARLVEAAGPYRSRWSELPPRLRHPGRLGRVVGYLVSKRDVLLLGIGAEPGYEPIDIDHITVAFRTLWRDGAIPSVSLDGDPFDMGGPQLVRVENIPEDSAYARVLLDADYEMKRLFFGEIPLAVSGWSPLGPRILAMDAQARSQLPAHARFWLMPAPFAPGAVRLSKDGALALFDTGARTLTEAMDLSEGALVGTGRSRSVDADMVAFTTGHFAEIEREIPSWRRLRGCFDLAFAADLLHRRLPESQVLDALVDLPLATVDVPESYRGLTCVVGRDTPSALAIVGGVSVDPGAMDVVVVRVEAARDLERLRAAAGAGPVARVTGISLPLGRGSATRAIGMAPEQQLEHLVRSGHLEEAVALATASVEEAPSNLRRRRLRVRLFLDAGLFGLAARDLHGLRGDASGAARFLRYRLHVEGGEAVHELPADARAWLATGYGQLAARAIGQDPVARAVRLADHAVRLRDDALDRWVRARARLAADDLAGAQEDIEVGLAMATHPALLLRARARLQLLREDYVGAIQDADAVLAIEEAGPHHPEAHVVRATAWLLSDSSPTGLAQAARSVDRALDLAPDYGWAHVLRARILDQQGYEDEALTAMDRAIALDPGSPHGYRERAYLRSPVDRLRVRMLNDLEFELQAFADCTMALRLDPRDLRARVLRGLLYRSVARTLLDGKHPAETIRLLTETALRDNKSESRFTERLLAAVRAQDAALARRLTLAVLSEAAYLDMRRACDEAVSREIEAPAEIESWRAAVDRIEEALE